VAPIGGAVCGRVGDGVAIRSVTVAGTLFEEVVTCSGVRRDHRTDGGGTQSTDAADESDAVVLTRVFGYDVVLEREFVEFPWRAGVVRGPVAAVVVYVLVFALAVVAGGVQGDNIATTLSYMAFVVYGLHNIPAARGRIPEVLEPVATDIVTIPSLRGTVLVGPNHGNPFTHLFDIATGKTESIGHINVLPTDPTVPLVVYGAIPLLVFTAVGVEYALRYWDEATVDSPVEVGRFGAAVGLGYVATLFVGTFLITQVGLLSVLILDRYMTVVFGFVYPALVVSIGALLVYYQQGMGDSSEQADAEPPRG